MTRIRVQSELLPRIESTSTSAGAKSSQTSGWRARQRSRPSRASFSVAARAISTSGTVVRRRPVGPTFLPGAGGGTSPIRRRDGWTRGGSPSCFGKCGGQGASGSPEASCSAASASSFSIEPGASSMPAAGSPTSAKRAATVSMVKAVASQVPTSSQRSGVETRASAVGRTE